MTSRIKVFNKNLSKSRKIFLLVLIVFLSIVIVSGLKSVYAYYYDSITSGILANKVGDFDLGSGDINIILYKENDEGKFTNVYSVPNLYYRFNDQLTSCTIPCNDGLGNCNYTFDSINKSFTLTSNQKITCKFYFEKEANSDINVFILAEDVNGTYENAGKNYRLIDNVPAYGYVYNNNYVCDGDASLTYNSETKKFSVEAKSQSNCYAYFEKVGASDINVNVYVQSAYGSDVYNSVNSIPSNRIYVLNESMSICKNAQGVSIGSAISYTNGYINISADEQQTCDVYLDLESN